jgi:alpha-galactosidase
MFVLSVAVSAAVLQLASGSINGQHASYNGLAQTPALGWNNWATFECDVNEELLIGTAQKLLDLGLKDLGYKYVVLDDCWSEGRNSEGFLEPDLNKFPQGMRFVSDRLHDMGLKFGMYSSAGKWTCAGFEGSLGHEVEDATKLAEWGVDYFKYDNCYNEGQYGTAEASFNRYKRMSDALVNSGREIVYSLCNWGEDSPWDWAPTIANSWRMAGDLYDSYSRPDQRCPCTGDDFTCKLAGFFCSFTNVLGKAAAYVSKARPGAWNDLDILEVGNGGSTDDEYITHFSMWAALKSPLMMGNDIRSMDPKAYSILTNPAVLAINQDPLGSSAARMWKADVSDKDRWGYGENSLWSGRLANGDQVVALINGANNALSLNATLDDIFVDSGTGGTSPKSAQEWDIYDLWANRLSDKDAQAIIDGSISPQDAVKQGLIYNSTAKSYAQGLAENEPLLFGKAVGTVGPHGTIQSRIPAHGTVLYRLRPAAKKQFIKQDL